tara:strand:- start:32 stop:361 length:330 start_codon:yes stop_codon:yes gene_type:complete
LWIEVCIEANFCRVFTSRNFDIAPCRRLNGWREFSALLLSHRPHSWTAALPITFIAARYDRSRSVVTDCCIEAMDIFLMDDRGQIADVRISEGKFLGVFKIDADNLAGR